MIELRLPWPPSVNHYRVPVRGRLITSNEGRAYHARCAELLLFHGRPPCYTGRVAVEIQAHPPDRRRRDLDNLLKPVLDVLTNARVIVDDSDIDDLRIVRGSVTPGGMLRVRVVLLDAVPLDSSE